jgi:hypothetical protein
MRSLLSATGQLATLRRAGACFALAFLCSIVTLLDREAGRSGVVAVVASVAFFVFVGIAMYVASKIRCPKCSARWFFYAIRSQPVGQWLPWLKNFSACPKCGFSTRHEYADAAPDESPHVLG